MVFIFDYFSLFTSFLYGYIQFYDFSKQFDDFSVQFDAFSVQFDVFSIHIMISRYGSMVQFGFMVQLY